MILLIKKTLTHSVGNGMDIPTDVFCDELETFQKKCEFEKHQLFRLIHGISSNWRFSYTKLETFQNG